MVNNLQLQLTSSGIAPSELQPEDVHLKKLYVEDLYVDNALEWIDNREVSKMLIHEGKLSDSQSGNTIEWNASCVKSSSGTYIVLVFQAAISSILSEFTFDLSKFGNNLFSAGKEIYGTEYRAAGGLDVTAIPGLTMQSGLLTRAGNWNFAGVWNGVIHISLAV